jgi:hypothetical protein
MGARPEFFEPLIAFLHKHLGVDASDAAASRRLAAELAESEATAARVAKAGAAAGAGAGAAAADEDEGEDEAPEAQFPETS